MQSTLPEVIRIICEIGGVNQLEPDQDFYDAGVSSIQSLPLLMQLEDRYNVSIPDERFTQVRTPRQISSLLEELAS